MENLTDRIKYFLEKHKIYYFIKKENDIVFCYENISTNTHCFNCEIKC